MLNLPTRSPKPYIPKLFYISELLHIPELPYLHELTHTTTRPHRWLTVRLKPLAWARQIRWAGCTVFLLMLFSLQACEKGLNLKLAPTPIMTNDIFDKTPGLELPYSLYMPSSMMGWELSRITQLHFDSTYKVYVLDNIPIDTPLLDEEGARFKLCSNAWRYQFGFGSYIPDAESTFGIPTEGIVVQVERFKEAANDLRIEFPANTTPATPRMMRMEFKLIANEPNPHGLIRVTLH